MAVREAEAAAASAVAVLRASVEQETRRLVQEVTNHVASAARGAGGVPRYRSLSLLVHAPSVMSHDQHFAARRQLKGNLRAAA
jgi:hypothetical protein